MKTYNFEVRDLGDIDVGLLPTISTITINSENELSDEQIQITKLFLQDLFDSATMVEVLDDNDLRKEIEDRLELQEMIDLERQAEFENNVLNETLKVWRVM